MARGEIPAKEKTELYIIDKHSIQLKIIYLLESCFNFPIRRLVYNKKIFFIQNNADVHSVRYYEERFRNTKIAMVP